MRAGAHDYVMKNNLRRLAPAIQRELHEAQERRRRSEAERALESERDYSRRLIEAANAMIVGLDPEGRITLFNRVAELTTGLARADVLGASVFDALIPRDRWPGGLAPFMRMPREQKRRRRFRFSRAREKSASSPGGIRRHAVRKPPSEHCSSGST